MSVLARVPGILVAVSITVGVGSSVLPEAGARVVRLAPPNACKLVTRDELTLFYGALFARGAPIRGDRGRSSICEFTTSRPGEEPAYFVTVQPMKKVAAVKRRLRGFRKDGLELGADVQSVDGVGDEAFFLPFVSKDGAVYPTYFATRRDHYYVQLSYEPGRPPDTWATIDERALVDQFTQVATLVLDRLPAS